MNRKRNHIARFVYIIAFLVVITSGSAQLLTPPDSSLDRGNFISTRFAKQFRVYQLNNEARGALTTGRFNIDLQASSESVIFKQQESSLRDEARAAVKMSYYLFEGALGNEAYNYSIGAASAQSMYYSTDSRTGGLSDLRRLNGAIGADFRLRRANSGEELIAARLMAGGEQNQLMNISSFGKILVGETSLNNIRMGGFEVSGTASYEDLELSLNRKNLDAAVGARIEGYEDEANKLAFFYSQTKRRRDFIAGGANGPQDSIVIERGATEDARAGAEAEFLLFEGFPNKLSIGYNSEQIDKEYNRTDPLNTLTAANRELKRDEFLISYLGTLSFSPAALYFTINYGARDERNFLHNARRLDAVTFNKLNELERQKDNSSSRLDALGSADIALGANNAIKLQYAAGILRYNTPSQANSDDRDEFSSSARVTISRRHSEYLTVFLAGEAIANHRVYLKASRSSGNYWRRIFRLAPSAALSYRTWTYNSTFEVMANYTAYDFETSGQQARSDSYRLLGWRDSLRIDLGKDFAFNLSNSLQYSERGRLFWSEYSEMPQANELMYFTRCMLSEKIGESSSVGVGARYFKLLQGAFTDYSKLKTKTTHSVGTISPETMISLLFTSKTIIYLNGWLDMIYDVRGNMTTNPTLLINTVIYL